MQQVLANPKWADKLTDADRRALSPLFWTACEEQWSENVR
jgi:hypothetical protein